MENIANIINSLATLLWPLIVIVILLIFRKSVQDLIDSASGRKFSVKIGEMELSMDELSQQQAMMIEDLQTRVNELQKKIEGGVEIVATKAVPETAPAERAEETETVHVAKVREEEIDIDDDISAILWVDDQPKNNALLIESLRKHGITVIPAESTQEALERFSAIPFNCVISDSCRKEGNKLENCQAGIELARKLRDVNDEVPIYIYTDKVNPQLKQKAESAGATAVTSSPSELLKFLSD
mgnify:CR=1 FL=1